MMAQARTERERWVRETLLPSSARVPERQAAFTTLSGRLVEPLYDATDVTWTPDGALPGRTLTSQDRRTGWDVHRRIVGSSLQEACLSIREALRRGVPAVDLHFDIPTLAGRDPNDESVT